MIHNAATEPEVVELALFLQRMGAQIALRPDRRFVIEGVESLSGATATLQGDRLEAFSYLVAGLMTGGEVRVGGCNQDRMVTAINTLQQMGATLEINDEWISASADVVAALRGADRHAPRVHDRLAAAPHRPDDAGRRHVGAARDRLRGPARLRRRGEGDGRRDRALHHLPGRPGVPLPRQLGGALRGGAGRVEAPGRRGHHPRRPRRVLVGDRRRGSRGSVHAARHPPPRARLQRPLRHPGLPRPPPPPHWTDRGHAGGGRPRGRRRQPVAEAGAQRRPEQPRSGKREPSAQRAATRPTAANTRLRPTGACSRSPSWRASGGRTSASTLPTAIAAPRASTR